MQTCQICNAPTSSCCADCQEVFYCSAQHQKQDWNTHKRVCSGRAKWTDSSVKITKQNVAASKQSVKKIAAVMSISKQIKVKELKEGRQSLRKKLLDIFYKPGNDSITAASKILTLSKQISTLSERQQDHMEYLLDGLMLIKLMNFRKMSASSRDFSLRLALQVPEPSCQSDNFTNELRNQHKNRIQSKSTFFQNQAVRYLQCYCKVTCLLAAFLSNFNQHTQAQRLYSFYLKAIQKAFGTNSLQTSSALFSFGVWLAQVRKIARAELCFHLSSNIRRKLLSPEHEAVSDCLFNQALCKRSRGDIQGAERLLKQSLDIRMSTNGIKSMGVAQVLQILGKLNYQNKNPSGSQYYFKKALQILNQILQDPRDPIVMSITKMLNMAREQIRPSDSLSEVQDLKEEEKVNQGQSEDELVSEEEIEIRLTKNLHERLTGDQLERLLDLYEQLQGVSSKRAGTIITGSQFLKSLNKSQQTQFIKQNEKYFN